MKTKDKQKISFRVSEILLAIFNNEILALPLARDQFLNNLIKVECEYLAKDMEGKRLSNEAKVFIANKLRSMEKGTRPVSVMLDVDVAARLNEIVGKTNIVRDAFVNRVIYFFLMTDKLQKYLGLGRYVSGINNINGNIPLSPIKLIEDALTAPFHYLRNELAEHDEKLYLLILEDKLVGFTCYAEYSDLPGTEEYKHQMEKFMNSI